jgi:hypothetical protein
MGGAPGAQDGRIIVQSGSIYYFGRRAAVK